MTKKEKMSLDVFFTGFLSLLLSMLFLLYWVWASFISGNFLLKEIIFVFPVFILLISSIGILYMRKWSLWLYSIFFILFSTSIIIESFVIEKAFEELNYFFIVFLLIPIAFFALLGIILFYHKNKFK